jgi:hypothetical protein
MRKIILAAAFVLSACVNVAPLEFADDHPANPKAAPGLIGISTTLEGYKTAPDFAARAVQEPDAPSGHAHRGHASHGAPQQGSHGSTQHGGHAGMQHGAAAPQPAPRR